MKKTLSVTVIGNSVALRVRPVEPYPGNLNYFSLLSDAEFNKNSRTRNLNVLNLARGGNTIKSAFKDFDSYIRSFPDLFILNFGVVDASTREVPKWFFDMYNSTGQYWYNNLSRWVYNAIIKKIRRPLVYLRGKRPWVGRKKYEFLYNLMIERLLKETNAIIIGLPINTADERIEKALPGSRRNHLNYNQVMENALDRERCYFINLQEGLTADDRPDGIHYSKSGHEKVARRIIDLIEDL